MKNQLSASTLTKIRTYPQAQELYLAVYKPDPILQAQITTPLPTTYPTQSISWNNGIGEESGIERNMTVWFGSGSSGSDKWDKGWSRVLQDYSSGSVLEIAETGEHTFDWAVGTWITVVPEYRAAPYYPEVGYSTFTDASGITACSACYIIDGIYSYTDQTASFLPQAVMGPPAVVWKGASTYDVYHVGELSKIWSEASGNLSASWTFADGTQSTTLGEASSPVIKEYTNASPGGAAFHLRVEDTNGKSHEGHRTVWAFDGDNMPYEAMVVNEISGGVGKGHSARLRVFGGAAASDFPDQAQVVLFTKSRFGASQVEAGDRNFPYRDNILFNGYIMSETIDVQPEESYVEFEVATIDAVLSKTTNYAITLENVGGDDYPSYQPQRFIEHKPLTIANATRFLDQWWSTTSEITDVYYPEDVPSENDQIVYQDLPRGSLWSMRQKNIEETKLGFSSVDMTGAIYDEENDIIKSSACKNGINVVNITEDDIIDQVQFTRQTMRNSAQVKMYAVDYATPIGAQSPADPAYWEGDITIYERGLSASPAELESWAGGYRADLNKPFKSGTVPLAMQYPFDAVPQSYITLTMSASNNNRNVGLDTSQRWLVQETRLSPDPETNAMMTTLVITQEASPGNSASITFPPPPTVTTEPDPWQWDASSYENTYEFPEPPEPDEPLTDVNVIASAVIATDNGIYKTANLNDDGSNVVWEENDLNIAGVSASDIIIMADGVQAYAVTEIGIYYKSDVWDTSIGWQENLALSDACTLLGASGNEVSFFPYIESNISQDTLYSAIEYENSCRCARTIYNNGDGWKLGACPFWDQIWTTASYVKSITPTSSLIFVNGYEGKGGGNILQSSDNGDSWSVAAQAPFGAGTALDKYIWRDGAKITGAGGITSSDSAFSASYLVTYDAGTYTNYAGIRSGSIISGGASGNYMSSFLSDIGGGLTERSAVEIFFDDPIVVQYSESYTYSDASETVLYGGFTKNRKYDQLLGTGCGTNDGFTTFFLSLSSTGWVNHVWSGSYSGIVRYLIYRRHAPAANLGNDTHFIRGTVPEIASTASTEIYVTPRRLLYSDDDAVTFNLVNHPSSSDSWNSLSYGLNGISSNVKLWAINTGGSIYSSSDTATTWTEHNRPLSGINRYRKILTTPVDASFIAIVPGDEEACAMQVSYDEASNFESTYGNLSDFGTQYVRHAVFRTVL
jgi:hypothetical protein